MTNDVGDVREWYALYERVGKWRNAVLRQRDRVAANADDIDGFDTDVHLYAVALNVLANAVKAAKQRAQAQGDQGLAGRLGKPMAAFKRAAPHYKVIRDIHEHIEEYERGEGLLQDDDATPGLPVWYTESAVNMVGRSLDVDTSATAAAELAEAVQAVLAPLIGR